MKRVRNILALIFIGIIVNIYGGNIYAINQINFENITIDNGLSQSTAEVILQDSDGYIWIGTNDGLNKYNGSEFEIYKNDKEDSHSIVNNHILSLLEDNDRNLWVGTNDGLSIINLDDYSVKNHLYYDNDKTKPFNNIHDLYLRKNGQVIMATYEGLYVYNKEDNTFEKIVCKNKDTEFKHIENIIEDENENIWIGTNSGLYIK